MFKKSILSLTAAALATLMIQAPVQASDSSAKIRDHRTTVELNVRDHRTAKQTKVRDHRVPVQVQTRDHRNPRKNEVVKVARKDCRLGYEHLRRSGYKRISILDCKGAEYAYLAQKNHGIFGARMNAYSGKVKVSFIGVVRSH